MRHSQYLETILTAVLSPPEFGRDENPFNVSLMASTKVTRPCPWTSFWKLRVRKEGRSEESNQHCPLSSLKPYHWAKPAHFSCRMLSLCYCVGTQHAYMHLPRLLNVSLEKGYSLNAPSPPSPMTPPPPSCLYHLLCMIIKTTTLHV